MKPIRGDKGWARKLAEIFPWARFVAEVADLGSGSEWRSRLATAATDLL